ncbi:MAG: glycosyltransferase [Burkholderiaceae bacterium]
MSGAQAAGAGVDVCVVVPTFRRPGLLERCLRALQRQTLAPQRFEVVVVDDGLDDETRRRALALAAECPGGPAIRYLRPGASRGPATARNCGWRATAAPVVAFTDDDTLPQPDWLREGLAALDRHPDWVAAAGCVQVPRDGAGRPTDHELMTLGLERAAFVTANAFVRRDALLRIGGFDERFRRAWREDSDLQFRLLDVGALGQARRAVVQHPARPERWGVSLRQQRNVFFDALLYRKHPRRYRRSIRPTPPWRYYAVVALAAAAAGLALASQPAAAAVALAAAVLLVLGLAARRLRRTSLAPGHVLEMLATSALIPFLSVYWRLRGAWHFRVLFL